MKKGFLKYPDFADKDLEIILDINHNSEEMGKMLNDRLKHKILIECCAQTITLCLQFLEHFMVLKKSNRTWVFLQVKCHMASRRCPLTTTKINDGARVSFDVQLGPDIPWSTIQIVESISYMSSIKWQKNYFLHTKNWMINIFQIRFQAGFNCNVIDEKKSSKYRIEPKG